MLSIISRFFGKNNEACGSHHRMTLGTTKGGMSPSWNVQGLTSALFLVVGAIESQKNAIANLIERQDGFENLGELKTDEEWNAALEKAETGKVVATVPSLDFRNLVESVKRRWTSGISVVLFPMFPLSKDDRMLANESGFKIGGVLFPISDLDQLKENYGNKDDCEVIMGNSKFLFTPPR